MHLTTKQIEQAEQMHSLGITWAVIASYLGTNRRQLRKQLKAYDDKTS